MNKLFFKTYIPVLLLFTLFSYLFVDSNLIYFSKLYTGFALSNRLIVTVLYTFFVFIFFYFYFLILRNQGWLSLKKIVLITCGILFFAYPAIFSYDIFNYIATSKTLFFYRENPYIVMPMEFIGDPLLLFTRGANKIALYGPIWILTSGLSFISGFGNFIFTLFNFKLLIAAFYLGSLILISKITKNKVAVAIFALNPLIFLETLVSSHNDIVMMFFALLSVLFLMKKRIFLAVVFILFSLLIKYSTIFLLPVFAYTIFKIIRKQNVNWEKVFFISFISMLIIFLLSFLREEIYPWYAIWFLIFSSLLPHKKQLLHVTSAFSFGLLLTYTPFMFLGTYFGLTPILKTFLMFFPVGLMIVFLFIRDKLWIKKLLSF